MRLYFHLAIEAMKNAHKEELEKTQRSQLSGLNSDIDELRLQYEYDLWHGHLGSFNTVGETQDVQEKSLRFISDFNILL